MKRRACVIGGGNSAHVAAGLIASDPDWECNILANWQDDAERLAAGVAAGGIELVYGAGDGHRRVLGRPARVSNDPAEVVPGCELLLLCMSAMGYDGNARAMAPHVDVGAAIGTVCASNGFHWCIDEAMAAVGRSADSYALFALQNLPWACRVESFGRRVDVLGAKPFMEIVVRPDSAGESIAAVLGSLLGVECPVVEGGFVGIGLSNLCQVIHPVVMWDNFCEWDGVTPYPDKPLFYQGMSERAAETMSALADEIQVICAAISERFGSDLSVVCHIMPWTLRAYGKYITDDATLRSRFASNTAYEGLTCPMVAAEGGGWLPDFPSRYLAEDVPYNLVAVRGVAELMAVPTPTIDRLVMWSQRVLDRQWLVDGRLIGRDLAATFAPQRFGIVAAQLGD